MPDIKTFYPGGSSTNPVNNSTASVSATTATNVDDQNQTANALVWTGTAAQYAALGSKDANTLYFVTA
jgi:hypothetical protein|tara:strand:+ start:254 stop:457 length:204 start_codon:yes stop_codon:yes gene_type:complete